MESGCRFTGGGTHNFGSGAMAAPETMSITAKASYLRTRPEADRLASAYLGEIKSFGIILSIVPEIAFAALR